MPCDSFDSAHRATAHIDLVEDTGLGYWTHELGCSADQLLAALESVGRDASDVAEFLQSCS